MQQLSSSQTNNKTFVIEKEETKQSHIVSWNIPTYSGVIDLKEILGNVDKPENKVFKIYNPEEDVYVPFEEVCIQPYMMPINYLELKIIMIKYCDDEGRLIDEISNNSSEEIKKQRSKERTIGEVIELVAKWRNLHSTTQKGKRINLQEAAKMLNISKKSLDDYFYQLRVGEKHEFDFTANINAKIGVLRAYIKEKQPQRKTKQKHAKHPKKLKIIEEFQKFTMLDKSDSVSPVKKQEDQIEKAHDQQFNEEVASLSEAGLFWGAPYEQLSRQSLVDCENIFMNQFRYDKEEDDPFLMFNRKNSESDNSSQNPFNFGF